MRIFYASDTTPNASFASNLWRNNLYLPLIDLGHDVIEFDYPYGDTFLNLDPSDPIQKTYIDRNRPLLSAELLKQIKHAHTKKPCDLFFSYFYDACIHPEVIDEIRAMGITTVNWYCNGSYQLHLVSDISPHYDWCLVPEKFRLKDYANMGAHPIYCQEAANPNIYRAYPIAHDYDVTFIGQAYGERPAYIKFILDSGVDIRVWGSGWNTYCSSKVKARQGKWKRIKNYLRELPTAGSPTFSPESRAPIALPDSTIGSIMEDEDLVRMYSRSKINLGFSTCGETYKNKDKILQVRLRDFEVPMCGGFYMVEYMEELEEFYEIGKEIVCYKSPEELVDKIKYYLRNDGEREAIRKAGYERCQRDHTWHKRFQNVFKEMGI
jgi:spore maturation protein CgeB